MPQRAWRSKRVRQYRHIEQDLPRRGESDSVAEVAAGTGNGMGATRAQLYEEARHKGVRAAPR